MSEGTIHLALFDEIDQAANALEALRDLGIQDEDMSIISGVPYSDRMLGRPMSWSLVPKLAAAGFALGFVIGVVMNLVTPLQYPIYVGGMPLISIPTSIVLTSETSMLGLLAFTFLGVIGRALFHPLGRKNITPPSVMVKLRLSSIARLSYIARLTIAWRHWAQTGCIARRPCRYE